MMNTFKKNAAKAILGTLAASAVVLSATSAANAHASVQLYGSTPTASGYGQMFVRIPHGCAGAATDTIKVQIPAGFASVKAQAKAGWSVSTVKADGTNVSEVTWSGGNLPDSNFDDFGLSVKFPATAGTYYVPIVQLCGASSVVWNQIPAAGEDSHSLASPAPSVEVNAAAAGHGAATGHGAAETATRWTGDVDVMLTHDNAMLTIDASSVNRGKTAKVRVTSAAGMSMIKRVKLDRAGDAQFSVKAIKRGKGAYAIKDGSTVEVLVGGKVIASTTVGGSSSHG
jgi:periplasmic copper chaperone A